MHCVASVMITKSIVASVAYLPGSQELQDEVPVWVETRPIEQLSQEASELPLAIPSVDFPIGQPMQGTQLM